MAVKILREAKAIASLKIKLIIHYIPMIIIPSLAKLQTSIN
jgi:hypothetical protein